MQIYLVGGAVRDQLLNLPVKDRDWLVVGETPERLLKQGFQQVGNDFPVFLHPKTNEEYALARTERKSGKGYNGFICDFSPEITLEQDLIRRDLTINAIAQDLNGKLFDPFNGVADLNNKILRHISPAFAEDPLRVLRVARFAARFHHLGFSIAEETVNLMKDLTACGELDHLTPERVWLETRKAFNTPSPHIYFNVLKDVGALKVLFPEINQLFGIIQPEKHHPEIDCGIHALMVLEQAKKLSSQANDPEMMLFGALCHDLGKGTTDKAILPHHYGHEKRGVGLSATLANRLKVPTHLKDFAKLTAEYHTHCHKIMELKPKTVMKVFNKFDVWRKPERFFDFLLVCEADSKGRLGFEDREYPQRDYAKQLYLVANQVNVQQVIADGFEKQAIREELNKRRQKAIFEYKNSLS
ncbi:multifunctional CCA addition/repair protein [Pasteurella skyensis]|uniref:Multifunctional CCA protein n=1 Tax=Phocoenobacter skyensis TaxID=97481 RepID=A0AAJ6N8Q6_9PAST|nr:multifunctional CCA addition/repair protein [Pasteurella skyensis]MDP8162390.1 multifunctional CCA addition/repair protein [Pasteurella skyensis]MDP8169732.1 multifunctional CCA addition/repair protein [Pasteurella skyensis]MDP8172276.1 multifunctional CCA addition/repair protein [Pasteurella skyensis]MDP8177090.1 multifunctional CCA addition/repair protein [Pasteurella skyensis]MDP8178531.1 multifunctional CCA addition/repair protein [Pasteurella skyensis]